MSVKLVLKKSTAYSLAFIFAFAVLCSSIASPSLAFASPVQSCSQNSSLPAKTGCEPVGLLCASDLVYGSALASDWTYGFSKDAPLSMMEVIPIGSSGETSLIANRVSAASVYHPAQKVSIHLFNSVLTL